MLGLLSSQQGFSIWLRKWTAKKYVWFILGDGGNGGHILFEASKEMNSLNHLKKEENGHNGTAGRKLEKEGRCGDHR